MKKKKKKKRNELEKLSSLIPGGLIMYHVLLDLAFSVAPPNMKSWKPGLRYRLWLHLLNHPLFRSIKEHWGSHRHKCRETSTCSLTLGTLLGLLGLHAPM